MFADSLFLFVAVAHALVPVDRGAGLSGLGSTDRLHPRHDLHARGRLLHQLVRECDQRLGLAGQCHLFEATS